MHSPHDTLAQKPSRRLLPLVVLNAVLLAILVSTLSSSFVQAQLGQRSNYLMVAGTGDRSSTDLVWILESRTGSLVTLDWTENGQGMKSTAHRNIQRDIENIQKSR